MNRALLHFAAASIVLPGVGARAARARARNDRASIVRRPVWHHVQRSPLLRSATASQSDTAVLSARPRRAQPAREQHARAARHWPFG